MRLVFEGCLTALLVDESGVIGQQAANERERVLCQPNHVLHLSIPMRSIASAYVTISRGLIWPARRSTTKSWRGYRYCPT